MGDAGLSERIKETKLSNSDFQERVRRLNASKAQSDDLPDYVSTSTKSSGGLSKYILVLFGIIWGATWAPILFFFNENYDAIKAVLTANDESTAIIFAGSIYIGATILLIIIQVLVWAVRSIFTKGGGKRTRKLLVGFAIGVAIGNLALNFVNLPELT